jgi:hypothetical protein
MLNINDGDVYLGSEEVTKITVVDVVDNLRKLYYSGVVVSPGGALDIATQIIRMLSDNKGSSSSRGAMEFSKESEMQSMQTFPRHGNRFNNYWTPLPLLRRHGTCVQTGITYGVSYPWTYTSATRRTREIFATRLDFM